MIFQITISLVKLKQRAPRLYYFWRKISLCSEKAIQSIEPAYCFVWFCLAPCLYLSGRAAHRSWKSCSHLTTWSRDIFSTHNNPKGKKLNFHDDAMPFTTISLKQKFWEISGNHNWHCYFEGLMADIITLYLLSPLVFSTLGWCLCCTLRVLESSQTHILLAAFCLQAENTNAHQSFQSVRAL